MVSLGQICLFLKICLWGMQDNHHFVTAIIFIRYYMVRLSIDSYNFKMPNYGIVILPHTQKFWSNCELKTICKIVWINMILTCLGMILTEPAILWLWMSWWRRKRGRRQWIKWWQANLLAVPTDNCEGDVSSSGRD